ncbi:hypothetical protein ETD86_14340 [Nonomuraea turkmeniaca]|uniref:Uncharacterized protein n=1 Tax=Nonomuraea turkmeniaca TaxID=103838 RepID=A0A5S4FM88_9ACTN|nr:hypothetical protein [Nonomuraea turkmeniaca]TMR21719.1 hypothetical protein ETD86_14340 [Nonomuraea turkmeniaca]
MNPHDAQSSLDDIRRLQDKTRDEYIRQGFALPYVLASAAGLFIWFTSVDLERPWSTVANVVGIILFVAAGIVQAHRTAVRRKPAVPDVVLFAGWFVGLMIAFGLFRIIGFVLFDLPASGFVSQGTFAAAGMAATYVATVPLIRRAIRAILRQETGRV